MSRQDREKHLETLGAAVEQEAEDEDANTTNTSSVNKYGQIWKNSGLPEFLRDSWSNAGQILNLEGIVLFSKSKDKRRVISLSRPISHTVEVKAKTLPCSECPSSEDTNLLASPS